MIPKEEIVSLGARDVLTEVLGITIPVTLDTIADISVVPLEVVQPHQFTEEIVKFNTLFKKEESHEGRIANVNFKVVTDVFSRRAVIVPGHKIFWTAA